MQQKIHRYSKGFTLIELVVVLAIMGVLAFVVGSKLSGSSSYAITSAEGRIMTQYRYVQLRAMKSGSVWGIQSDGTNYWAFRGTNPNTPTMWQAFPGEDSVKVSLSELGLTMTVFTLYFDKFGIPYTSYTSPSVNTKVSDTNILNISVILSGDPATRVILRVTPETGALR